MRIIKDFLWFIFQILIEPILLTSALAILSTRIYSISVDIYTSTGSTSITDILLGLSTDMEADPMIYWILVVIFMLWFFYRAWSLHQEHTRDKTMVQILDELKTIATEIKNLRQDTQNKEKKDD